MKNILFDNIIYSLQQSGGISSMWSILLESMLNDNRFDFRCIELNNSAKNNIFRSPISFSSNKIIQERTLLPNSIERYRKVAIPNNDNFAVFHSSYYRIPSNPSIKSIITVHDFTYEKHVTGIKKKIHCYQKYNAINHADIVVCVSKNTYNDLIHYLPHINKKKIHVIYNGISSVFQKLKDVSRGENLLYVGSRSKYKNFELFIESVSETTHHIDICGTPLTHSEQKYLNKKLGENRYTVYSNIDNVQLNKLYNSAKCLIYPSNYEGFGLPIIEAQSVGCPVIALNASSIPEIIGETPLLLQEATQKEILKALSKLENQTLIEETIEAGKINALRFSNTLMTDRYKELYLTL